MCATIQFTASFPSFIFYLTISRNIRARNLLYAFCIPVSNKYWLLAIKEQTNNSLKDLHENLIKSHVILLIQIVD